MEAWSWLERNGLIAPSPDGDGWYFITRQGQVFQATSNETEQSIKPPSQITQPQSINPPGDGPPTPTITELRQAEPPSEERNETILTSGLSDQAAIQDALGFEPYVKAIGDFLTDEETEPPITLSIEGEWGTGKSSFMLQLREMLSKKGESIVVFNAWRHDKADELWAAFALDFIRQISEKQLHCP